MAHYHRSKETDKSYQKMIGEAVSRKSELAKELERARGDLNAKRSSNVLLEGKASELGAEVERLEHY